MTQETSIREFAVNDVIQARPEWADPADPAALFVVVEANGDRGFARLIGCDLPIPPRDLVRVEHFQRAGFSALVKGLKKLNRDGGRGSADEMLLIDCANKANPGATPLGFYLD